MSKKAWNRRSQKRAPLKIKSTEKSAESVRYITLEQWFEDMETTGKAIILPKVKEYCIRQWWLNNLQRSLQLRGRDRAFIARSFRNKL